MKLALTSATLIKLSTWLSDFVSASVQCCKWPLNWWRFFPFVTTRFTLHFSNYYFPSWKFAFGSSSVSVWNAGIVHALIYIDTSVALQSQWYTRPSEFLTRSSDQCKCSQVNQIRNMCRNMRLYTAQQFISFVRNLSSQFAQYKCCLVQNCTIF